MKVYSFIDYWGSYIDRFIDYNSAFLCSEVDLSNIEDIKQEEMIVRHSVFMGIVWASSVENDFTFSRSPFCNLYNSKYYNLSLKSRRR